MLLAEAFLKVVEKELLVEAPPCRVFNFGPHFKESYERHKSPAVEKRFKRFIEVKTGDIIQQADKRDYPLGKDKRLSSFMHCHLDGDVLLIYHRHNNDEITLDYVATHKEISGNRVHRLPIT
jgi:mRNA-degrading endonuclease YafQ of YafQ-DinJ toxin-antitoxin module